MTVYEHVFRALNGSDARYVTVGGFALLLHGALRTTADLDLMIDLEPGAAAAAIGALSSLGLTPRVPVDPADFADPAVRQTWIDEKGMTVFTMWDPSDARVAVDLFVSHPVEFERAWSDAVVVDLGGTQARVASIATLIEMKTAVGRPTDLADIEILRAIEEKKGHADG